MDDKALEKFIKPERVVKARMGKCRHFPVVAIYDGWALSESGELMTEQDLIRHLPKMSARLFIRLKAAEWVVQLDREYRAQYPGTWNCRFVTKENNLIQQNGFLRPVREQVVCHYFGWKTSGRGDYHKILDPLIFFDKKPQRDPDKPYIRVLLEWGVSLRDFCGENSLDIRCTAGGIAGQFLTDPRFYPDSRRKVPRATNSRVREVLPGNYYYLNVAPEVSREYTAYYMDQRSSHHYHARNTIFPHSDELYAYGRFVDLAGYAFDRVWDSFTGLYCLDLAAPKDRMPNRWLRDWLHHNLQEGDTLEKRFVYSNELPHLLSAGYRVIGVRAAWGSHKRDTGLNKYAEWASEQLEQREDLPWLKRLLLATYGILAVTPQNHLSLYARATKGELASVRVEAETFTGYKIQQKTKLEPRIANVLHRGMIEASCRSESIRYSDWLERSGYHVLSIYSDAVVVEVNDDLPEPLTPEPWRLKRTLTHLQFINAQAYRSAEECKIPGGASRDLVKHLRATAKS